MNVMKIRKKVIQCVALWLALQAGLISVSAEQVGVKAPGPATRVKMTEHGLPIFTIDDKPHFVPSFESYVPSERHFRQFGEAGTEVYGFPANAGMEPWWHSTPVWVGECVWDFSEFDASVKKVLDADPDGLILPRIHIAEPDWWREKYPAELTVFDDGTTRTTGLRSPYRLWLEKESRTFASPASKIWREDMKKSLGRLIDHIQTSWYADHVFGYQILGMNTEEWYHFGVGDLNKGQLGDYSEPMRQGFRAWLRQKYGNETALREAWSDPELTFDQIELPSVAQRRAGSGHEVFRDPQREMNVIDYYQYYNEIIPDTIDTFCKVVKEKTGGTKVVGAFYAYFYEFSGRPDTGHMATAKLLQSPNIDFIVVTASYGERQLGSGGSILRSPHTSLFLHDKVWYEDNDNVSFLFPEVSRRIGDNEWERSKVVLAATDTAEESRWIYLRGAGFVLGNGIYQSLFDLHGGYFDNPELMATVKDINELFHRAITHDRSSVAEILVIADEHSTYYPTIDNPLNRQNLYIPPYQLIKIGAPYDSIYTDDLALIDMSPYKLVILLNQLNMTDQQQTLIEEKVKAQGRTVLWVNDVGRFNNAKNTPERLTKITDIQLMRAPETKRSAPFIRLQQSSGGFTDRLIEAGVKELGSEEASSQQIYAADAQAKVLGVDANTGEPVLVSKQLKNYTSVFTPTASLSRGFYRELARSAGVNIYNDRDDTVYVSHDFLTINADGAGTRNLKFPDRVDIYDALTETALANDVTEFALTLNDKETRILRLVRKPAVKGIKQ